jgi:hypothetical protein
MPALGLPSCQQRRFPAVVQIRKAVARRIPTEAFARLQNNRYGHVFNNTGKDLRVTMKSQSPSVNFVRHIIRYLPQTMWIVR